MKAGVYTDMFILNTENLYFSDEEFEKLCTTNKELRLERDKDRNILIMSPTHYDTGNNNAELSAEFIIWNRKYKMGRVFDSSTGFTLSDGSMRSPDVSFIFKEKDAQLSLKERKSFAHITPDFVVELLSDTDILSHLQYKIQCYLDNEVPICLLIDPKRRLSELYLLGKSGFESFSFNEVIKLPAPFDTLKLKLADIIGAD